MKFMVFICCRVFAIMLNNPSVNFEITGRIECPLLHLVSSKADKSLDSTIFFSKHSQTILWDLHCP